MSLEWKSDKVEGQTESSVKEEPVLQKKASNVNLTKDEIKAKVQEFENKYPDDLLQPFILKGVATGKNRIYILRAITMADMEKVEEHLRKLEEEEIKNARESGKKDWFNQKRKDGKNWKTEDDLDKDELEKLNIYLDQYVSDNADNIGKRVNELVVNMMGVVFPEDHSRKVQERKVPYGDITLLAASIQVHSGWSDIETDIEAYDESKVEEDMYEGL